MSAFTCGERAPGFVYRGRGPGELHAERVPLARLAQKFGTPLYVYSATAIRERYAAFDAAFGAAPHTVCYSVKANSSLAVLRMLARLGSGFDVVSGGELERVRRAAPKAPGRVVFSGVGKTAGEMDAALKARILLFNVESESELALLAARAGLAKRVAPVALRVNPDVPAETHPYIATGLREHKFGVAMTEAERLYDRARDERRLQVAGVSVHIGSQITAVAPFAAAMERVAGLVRRLRQRGHDIRYVDAGGGLGISYASKGEAEGGRPSSDLDGDFAAWVAAYAQAIVGPLRGLGVHLLLEPGRAIVGQTGALVPRVLYVKRNGNKRFVVVDAAMNDLIRPSLYGAHHEIVPVVRGAADVGTFDVVGPVCETGDFFARDRRLPEPREGDLVALLDAGAYGMPLASNYNTRGRAAEVMVEGSKARLVRRRETVKDLLRVEL